MTENETVERLKCMRLFMQINDKASESKFLKEDYIANQMAIKALEEIQQYRAIGTVEECREARERQRAKKVNNRNLLRNLYGSPYSMCGDCPNCGSVNLLSINTDYCNTCGQKLDWGDTL